MNFLDLARAVFGLAFTLGIIGLCAWAARRYAPDGSRSFPRKHLAKGHREWNHYYIRAINGEVRLWVNGEEVSGGNGCEPASGYLCLESEGSPIIFRKLRIRELP